ncbi:MAG: hypothetical protein ACLS2V_13015 [Clostridium paraputrificum]|uniref:hypothetical protein n=1 Tax=Clostridium sp. TaxID=1506 RepID=UPI0025BCCA0D|nr:hypothetical protein [Clostridium sp.]MBS5926210.1 hypothetical protein [Clostridium sp.]
MKSIIIVCSVLGVLIFASSFITFKPKKRNRYKESKKVKRDKKISNNKLSKFIVGLYLNSNTKSSKKYINKLTLVGKSKTSEENREIFISQNSDKIVSFNLEKIILKVFSAKITVFFLVLIIGIGGKILLSTYVETNLIHPETLYERTEYRLGRQVTESIASIVQPVYKEYFKNDDVVGLGLYIKEYSNENKFSVDDEDIRILLEAYSEAYAETFFNYRTFLTIFLIALISTLLVDLTITLKCNIYNAQLLKEFEKLEIVAMLHMGRNDVNILEIIKEMTKYSIYLKPYLERCLNMYTSNTFAALDNLITEIPDQGFKNFILILKSCLESPKEVNLNVLKIQRELRLELENTKKNKVLKQKELYLTIAQFPLMMLAALNLIIPGLTSINI